MPFRHQTASRGSERPPTGWRTRCARWALFLCASLVALTSSAAAQSGLDELNTAIARLAEEVLPSVVQIESSGFVPATDAGADSAVSLQVAMGTGVNGQSPRSVEELESALTRIMPGESVVLQIERAGRLSFVVAEFF